MSKKSIVEVTGFLLITLLVVVFSLVAYTFSKEFIEEKKREITTQKLEESLNDIAKKIDIHKNLGAIFLERVEISEGSIHFNESVLYYLPSSQQSFSSSNAVCFEYMCSFLDSDVKYINISPYNFTPPSTFFPGIYDFFFEVKREEKQVVVSRKK